jgi:flagellar hook assembly protein FlgD
MKDPTTQLTSQVAQLTAMVGQLTKKLQKFEDSTQYTFAKDIQILDGRKIKLGGTQGTKIGVSTSKIGLYGASPVAQYSAISAPSGGTTVDTQARTAISSLIIALHNVGLTQ